MKCRCAEARAARNERCKWNWINLIGVKLRNKWYPPCGHVFSIRIHINIVCLMFGWAKKTRWIVFYSLNCVIMCKCFAFLVFLDSNGGEWFRLKSATNSMVHIFLYVNHNHPFTDSFALCLFFSLHFHLI